MYCYNHDPANAEERSRNGGRRGGSDPGKRIKDLDALLSKLYRATEAGQVDRATATVLNQILNTRARLVEAEHRLEQIAELEHQVESMIAHDRAQGLTTPYFSNGGTRR